MGRWYQQVLCEDTCGHILIFCINLHVYSYFGKYETDKTET